MPFHTESKVRENEGSKELNTDGHYSGESHKESIDASRRHELKVSIHFVKSIDLTSRV